MRVNKYVAQATGKSRRTVDTLIESGSVIVNGVAATPGQQVREDDLITINGRIITAEKTQTILLHKPVGYVCSRNGQGSKTIYDLLPKDFQKLKSVGRLDKDSSGLILLTNNGELAHKLTHPSFHKEKIYLVSTEPKLRESAKEKIEIGIKLDDGISKFKLKQINGDWHVTIHEGRNRQIRRTFKALGYTVTKLHRIKFGDYTLSTLRPGEFKTVE